MRTLTTVDSVIVCGSWRAQREVGSPGRLGAEQTLLGLQGVCPLLGRACGEFASTEPWQVERVDHGMCTDVYDQVRTTTRRNSSLLRRLRLCDYPLSIAIH